DTGVTLLSVVPVPSWPLAFCPQQRAVPSERTAHAWLVPPVTKMALGKPETVTGTKLVSKLATPPPTSSAYSSPLKSAVAIWAAFARPLTIAGGLELGVHPDQQRIKPSDATPQL